MGNEIDSLQMVLVTLEEALVFTKATSLAQSVADVSGLIFQLVVIVLDLFISHCF